MLWGRSAELSRVSECVDAARAEQGRALVVHGDGGVGKSALIEAAARGADGFSILRASGMESEVDLAFGGLAGLLAPVIEVIDELPGPQAAALRGALALGEPVPVERLAVAAATLTVLTQAAEYNPVLVVADDAQWLDPSSREALLFAARRLGADRVAILLAVRTGVLPRSEFAGLEALSLEGIEGAATIELLRERLGLDPPAAVVDELVLRTAGNPLAILEIAGALDARQLAGVAPIGEVLPVGEGVQAAMRSRLRGLKPATRLAVTLLAAAGPADIAGLDSARAALEIPAGALDEAQEAGVIGPAWGDDRFTHPLMRSAVYAVAHDSERKAAHRALADGLLGNPPRRAWHLAAAAGDVADEEVAEALDHVAGMAMARGDLAAAARASERAARLSPDSGLRRSRFLRAGSLAAGAGQPATAKSVLSEALILSETDDERAEVVMATALAASGNPALESLNELLGDLASLAERASPMLRAALLSSSSYISWGRFDPRGSTLAKEGRLLSEKLFSAGVIPAEMAAPMHVSALASDALWGSVGDVSAATASTVSEMAAMLATLPPGPADTMVFPTSFALCATGDPGGALRIAHGFLPRARTFGSVLGVAWIQNAIAAASLALGDLALARSAAAEARELSGICGAGVAEGFAAIHLAWIAVLQGDEGAYHDSIGAGRTASIGWEPSLALCDHVEGFHLALAGRLDQAAEALQKPLAAVNAAGVRNAFVFPLLPELVETLVRLERHAEAATFCDQLEALAPGSAGGWGWAVTARCRGLLADEAEMDAHFIAAAGFHAQHGGRLEGARTAMIYGERLRRAHRTAEAREQLELALGVFDAVGAVPWAERCRTELRASGAQVSSTKPTPTGDLTPQEYQVVLEVAAGRSNAEAAAALFLSRKTIEMHLTQAYRKLGVRSRTQLVRVLANRGELPD